MLSVAFASGAVAADMPVKARPIAPAPEFNWTGFYIGGHVGGGWSDKWRTDVSPRPLVVGFDFNTARLGQSGSSLVGGAQAGYNWQFAPNWVTGIEGDFSWSDIGSSTTLVNIPTPGGPLVGDTLSASRNLDWLASVRGRLGYTWDRVLIYGTGGAAWGKVKYTAGANFIPTGGLFGNQTIAFSETESGWVAGGGLEYALPGAWRNWTIRGEYLFYSLKGATGLVPSAAGGGFFTQNDWNRTALHVARFGLNYRFAAR